MIIVLKDKHTLKVDDFNFRCCIGKRGKSSKKKEGDLKTPKGKYNLGDLYYRADREPKPQTKLKCIIIKKNTVCCNDLKSEKNYNRLLLNTKNFKHEILHRKDSKYDFVLPIKNNSKNKVGKGRCIFFHLTKNYQPTAGCVALKRKDFLIFLKLINTKTKILIK